jgi:hypothetical protein
VIESQSVQAPGSDLGDWQATFPGKTAQDVALMLATALKADAVCLAMWDEIRMRLQDEHEKEACALLIENDVYGYNFHKGIAAGCNKLDIAIRAALQAPNKPS